MKQEYIEAITKQMQECDDISLLDLIHQILGKAGGNNVGN